MKTRSQIHTPIMKWQTSDTDRSFKRIWSKPPTQTQPSKDSWKPAHMQNGPGETLAVTLTTSPAKHNSIGRGRRRRQQTVEISHYLYCEQSTMTTLTWFKRHLTSQMRLPVAKGWGIWLVVRWTYTTTSTKMTSSSHTCTFPLWKCSHPWLNPDFLPIWVTAALAGSPRASKTKIWQDAVSGETGC